MPCTYCSNIFNKMPCKTYEETDPDDFCFPAVKANRFHEFMFKIRWDLMHQSCPCIDCLVKISCRSLCEKFIDDIIIKSENISLKD